MISISLVPTDEVDNVLPIVGPMLIKATDRSNGRFGMLDVLHDLMHGDQSLWVALDDDQIIGCVTVRIVRYPSDLTTLSYEYLGGERVMDWIEEGHRVLCEYAKEYGCTRLEVPQGRKGWDVILSKLGYKLYAYRYECNLKE